ncbi:DNA methyltransferase [Bowmanella yangjiangensis]|uniref:Methyltransferase n=1 Tax=Bowmanella yangjiangensis TaxID=2811230 RepID=A0ABS3CQG2_9ALTE|nr:DNA methyltransferase [Bowmanella yangjiangensis]MBN7819327.1 hypothetical protein [Bowmanella yangjiangensis]
MNKTVVNNLGLLDWDFKEISTKEIFPHNICWYPSRYIPQIPAMLINELSNTGDRVLDPFCGSGTTLIESARLNRPCVGIDINPLATFMTNVKIELLGELDFHINDLLQVIDNAELRLCNKEQYLVFSNDSIPYSNIEELRGWFHETTLSQLFSIWSCIEDEDGHLKDVLKLLFISILMPCSGLETKKPYTYYADKVKPKDNVLFKDAMSLFKSRMERVVIGLSKRHSTLNVTDTYCENKNIDEFDFSTYGMFDLIVTSPPYLSVTDYSTGFRLAHLWYNFSDSIDNAKSKEIGARWKRKRSNSYQEYMTSMRNFVNKVSEVMNDDAFLCLVIGESAKYQGKVIEPLSEWMEKELGLKRQISKERSVNQNYFIHPTGGVKKEEILVLRR